MKRSLGVIGAMVVAALWLLSPARAWAQDKPAYTPAEYNAYKACADDKNPQTRATCLEGFLAKFPDSTLKPYVLNLLYTTFNELKNYPKSIEYADELLAFGDKLDLGTRVQATYIRSVNYQLSYNPSDPKADEQARRARDAALQGVELLGKLPKPENMTPEQFEQQKKAPLALFYYTAGFASLQIKDYAAAITNFKSALANNPNDAVTYFRLGVADFQSDPPLYMDGFWALARSVALKGPGEAQVRSYLRGQLIRYQGGTVCEKETDTELNELLTLAAGTADRPAEYKIPSAADLDAARKNPEWLKVLRTGGADAKVTWLAMCGLEFPEVFARVFEVTSGNDSIVVKVFTGASQEEMDAATAPNCEVHIAGEPRAANFEKDDIFRFSGTLAGYAPDPFMLTWDKAKVNPEDLPEEKKDSQPSKRPAKRPGKRPPTR